MRPGIVVSLAEELSLLNGILGELLYRFGAVMLAVMYKVTLCVDRVASPTSLSRTQGISACEMFSLLNEGGFSTKRTALRGCGYLHLMGPYKDIWMCRSLRIKTNRDM